MVFRKEEKEFEKEQAIFGLNCESFVNFEMEKYFVRK